MREYSDSEIDKKNDSIKKSLGKEIYDKWKWLLMEKAFRIMDIKEQIKIILEEEENKKK